MEAMNQERKNASVEVGARAVKAQDLKNRPFAVHPVSLLRAHRQASQESPSRSRPSAGKQTRW